VSNYFVLGTSLSRTSRPGDTTINAQYTIDPDQNGGLNYQYDLVVRNKDERRRLDAGDCECCREVNTDYSIYFISSLTLASNLQYYEGVGPLPGRLQPPLWRSPPATPVRPCLRHSHPHSPEGQNPPGSRTRKETHPRTGPASNLHHQHDIESHKKAISRHRHAWARATTPPGYWEIGFPDTQAVGDINEKAKQMHKRKKAEIEKEAGNEVGRYRRR
jgi:DNA repair protein endonuclease SAE2/CtIP C-terminus